MALAPGSALLTHAFESCDREEWARLCYFRYPWSRDVLDTVRDRALATRPGGDMTIESAFILMFAVATAVAVIARRARLPYTVALVLAGLALGYFEFFPAPHLTKELLLFVFLPGLIFEAALHIDWHEFRSNALTIFLLAVPGVVVSMALVTLLLTPLIHALKLAPGFTWKEGLVFGALISATDPVAVVALFRTLGAPKRLTLLLDAESLLNDGTAIVFYTLSLSLYAASQPSGSEIGVHFLSVVGFGAALGGLIGYVTALLMRRIDDPMIEITMTTVAAYGSFVVAESLHTSGIIATVVAGMLCGNIGRRSGMSASTRIAADSFWEYTAFALNSIVFLLIGFEVHLRSLLDNWIPILVAYGVVTIGRGVVIALGRLAVHRTRERFSWRWGAVLTWGGLRGALPMVLALTLPADVPLHELIVSMTFGVAVISILVHGITMSPLLRLLGIVSEQTESGDYEIALGRLQAANAALAEIEQLMRAKAAPQEILTQLRDEYRESVAQGELAIRELIQQHQGIVDPEVHRIRRRLLLLEKDEVTESFRRGHLGSRSHATLQSEIDSRLNELQRPVSENDATSHS
jgi:CPA1 family monovalent cation:H+ antiporter